MSSSLFKISIFSSFLIMSLTACATTNINHPKTVNKLEQVVDVHSVSAQGIDKKIGTITLQDTSKGLSITSRLTNLPSGFHGFHIHEKGSCEPAMKDGKMVAALAAGGHFNPTQTAHGTPNDGHMCDKWMIQHGTHGLKN